MISKLKLSTLFCLKLLIVIWAGGSVAFLSGCQKDRPVQVGESSPGISGTDISGRGVNLDQLKGKIVVIYFWRNSCCGNSLKQLEPFYQKNREKGVAVLAINETDAKNDVESYAKINGLTFTMMRDENSVIFNRYQGMGFPTIFILDGNGVIREKILGDIQIAKLETLVQRRLDVQKQAEASYEKLHHR